MIYDKTNNSLLNLDCPVFTIPSFHFHAALTHKVISIRSRPRISSEIACLRTHVAVHNSSDCLAGGRPGKTRPSDRTTSRERAARGLKGMRRDENRAKPKAIIIGAHETIVVIVGVGRK